MSWSTYLLDNKNKIIIEAGKVGIEDIRDDAKSWADLMERTWEREGLDTSTNLVDLTVKDAAKLLEAEEMIAGLSGMRTRIMALEYIRLHEVAITQDNVVGDDKVGKYKGYKLI